MTLACQKYPERLEACRETWATREQPHVFVVGRPGQQPALCGDVLYLNCPDDYMSLPIKVWTGIRECLARFEFDWLFKCDDDTFVNTDRLHAYPRNIGPQRGLREFPRVKEYIGRKVNVHGQFDPNWHKGKDAYSVDGSTGVNVDHTKWFGPWADGGLGYFLSRKACRLVAAEPYSHVLREAYEDKMVGHIMGSHGIYLHGQQTNFRRSIEPWIGAVTIHPLDQQQMREAYWQLFRAGELGT
jgi:hypothetical protein